MKKAAFKLNRWITAAAAMVALLVLVFTAKAAELESVSLEQQLRCGLQTHLHTEECYKNDILVCPKTEHVHSTNCYLVLLADNDMGIVLNETEAVREKTLEAVIQNAVDSALVFNNLSPTQEAISLNLDEVTISELNETIRNEDDIPPLVLNENLNKFDDMTSLLEALDPENMVINLTPAEVPIILQKPTQNPDDEEPLEPEESEDVPSAEIQATGVNPVTNNNRANVYIMLNGSWNCIGNVAVTNSNNTRTVSAKDINALLKDVDGETRSDTAPNYTLRYAAGNGAYTTYSTSASRTGTFTLTNTRTYWGLRLYEANPNSTQLKFYTVDFVYPTGTIQKIFHTGTVINFNTAAYADYNWTTGGKTYTKADTLTVTQKMTLTASLPAPPDSINIQYTMNFPTNSGVTFPDANLPTFASGGKSTYSYSTAKDHSITLEDISNRYPESNVWSGHSPGQTRVIHFAGWRVGTTNTILQPGATLSWEAISQYATGNTLKLNGVWEYHTSQSCTFYLRYDSVAVDIDGNITSRDQNLYTPQLHSTFVANIDTTQSTTWLTNHYGVADTTADNSYQADQNIRALYGERPDTPYLVTFPDDEDVFMELRKYADHLSVDNIPVKAEDLNSNGYAIRWYVFKCQSDAWHVDGKLVRKQGNLEITKTFAGNKKAISEIKPSFYIEVVGSQLGTKKLTVQNADSYDAATDTYFWSIPGMTYGEKLTIHEYNYQLSTYRCFSEYSVIDAAGVQSTGKVIGYPGTINLTGMTYATDTGFNEVLHVDLTNVYYGLDSLVLKKLDEETGNSLAGAEFELWQTVSTAELEQEAAETEEPAAEPDEPLEQETIPEEEAQTEPLDEPPAELDAEAQPAEEILETLTETEMSPEPEAEVEAIAETEATEPEAQPVANEPMADDNGTTEVLLRFTKDPETGAYHYDPNGQVTRLSATNGFYEVSINGISLERGPVTVKEVVVPEGYSPIEALVLTKENEKIVVENNAARFENNVLYIPNNSHKTSIIAEKHWECAEKDQKEVTILLMANGHLVTTLFPALADDSLVVLNADNNWTYRWSDLPVYANGAKIDWSIREVRVGSEKIRDDGSFLNYLVRYDSVTDENGDLVLRVWNDVKRIMLRVTKTNWARDSAVPGATYLLQRMVQLDNGSYVVDNTFDTIRLTSDASGLMIFEGIQYGRYLLVEESAPAGFYLGDPVELTLNEDGSITIWSGPADYNGIVYNLTVRDLEKAPMPVTGSSSELWFRIAGVAMLLMLLTPILLRKRRCRKHS